MIKLALLSDWHWGITKPQSIHKAAKKLAAEKPDLVINAGDNCGGTNGARATRQVFKALRAQMPDVTILSVLGNHDLWSGTKYLPSYADYQHNLVKLAAAHQEFNIQNLSTLMDPVYFANKQGDTIEIFGQMMWYEQHIRTNDYNFLPLHTPSGEGIYLELVKQEERAAIAKLQAAKLYTRVFVSHMPVLDMGDIAPDRHGGWWGANRRLGEIMQKDHGVDIFLNGHTHGNLNGPVRYECGSDYGKPLYKIIEIP